MNPGNPSGALLSYNLKVEGQMRNGLLLVVALPTIS